MKYNVGDKVYHKYHKAICKIIDIDFFRKKYRVVVNGKAIWTYEEEDALEPYTETECERDKCVNAESCEKCKEESIPTMHYPQVDGVTPSVIKHDEPLSQEEIDRCLTALSERDSINDYPEKYPKTDAVVAGREMTKYKLSDYDEGHRDGYEVGYENGCKDTKEKLAKAYASGAGFDIGKIKKETYQQGFTVGMDIGKVCGRKEAWECIRKIDSLSLDVLKTIFMTDDIGYIVRNNTVFEVMAKMNDYESRTEVQEKRNAEIIRENLKTMVDFYGTDRIKKVLEQMNERETP